MIRRNTGWLATLGVFLAWFLVFGPANLGGPATYVVVDGTSMEPTFVDGDLAVVHRSDTYEPGDIIAFRVPGSDPSGDGLVIHRIVGGTADEGFLTQGDNRPDPDPWLPRSDEIAGVVWFVVPGIGASLMRVRDPLVLAPLAAALTVFLVMLSNGSGERRSRTPMSLGTVRGSRGWSLTALRFRRVGVRAIGKTGGTTAIVAGTFLLLGLAAAVRL